MSINYTELKKIIISFHPIMEESTIQEITQLSPDELFLEVRKSGYTYPVFIKIHQKYTFIGKIKPYRNAPLSPYNFTSSLRKHLISKKIVAIKQMENDRIVQLEIPPYQLIIELTGRNGNIFLLKDNIIINVLFKRNGQKRKELPEEPYVYLPNPSTKIFNLRPEIELFSTNSDYSEKVALYYYNLIAQDEIGKSIHIKTQALEKSQEYLEKIEKSIRHSLDFETENEKGNLLLSYQNELHSFPVISEDNEKKAIQMPSYINNDKNHEIVINKRLSITANASVYFTRYKKMKKRIIELEKHKLTTENEVKELSNDLSALNKTKSKLISKTLYPLDYLKQQYIVKSKLKRSKNKEDAKIILLHTRSEKSVIAGKSALANIYVLKKYGKGNFWWFHCRDFPGSFVILQEENLSSDDVEDCGTIALFFSKARNNAKGEIIYTRCKYVKQIPGQTGKVNYSNDSNFTAAADYSLMKKFSVKD